MISPRFRRDYDGEFVIKNTKIHNNQVIQTREWIPNIVTNQHVSPRAVVVGGRDELNRFDFRKVRNNKGGLLAKKALQSYGTADLWRDMPFHFFVTTNSDQAQSMIQSGYVPENLVYATSKICIDNPGNFYPIPYLPNMDELALAVYLAAFDEHDEIYMLNYNEDTPGSSLNWIENVNTVIKTYQSVRFINVGVEASTPGQWRYNPNFSIINHRQFVTYCDI